VADLIGGVDREARRLEGMGQLGFGFDRIAGSETPPANAAEDELFVDGEPRELFVGARRRDGWKPI
jgi:hypothetical protein